MFVIAGICRMYLRIGLFSDNSKSPVGSIGSGSTRPTSAIATTQTVLDPATAAFSAYFHTVPEVWSVVAYMSVPVVVSTSPPIIPVPAVEMLLMTTVGAERSTCHIAGRPAKNRYPVVPSMAMPDGSVRVAVTAPV